MFTLIIDAHVHGPGQVQWSGTRLGSGNSADEMIGMMDENGIDVVVTFPPRPTPIGWDSYLKANNIVADAVKKYPNRIIGFVRFSPYYSEVIDYLQEAIDKMGFSGLKLHPKNEAFSINSETLVHPLMEKAAKLRIPVLTHSGHSDFCTPLLVSQLAESFPDVTLIMGHMGGDRPGDAIYFAKRIDNLVLETSLNQPLSILKSAIKEVGVEKIVFGSDMGGVALPYSPKYEIMRFDYLDITDAEKEMVMGKNIARILDKEKQFYD